jgi:O-antigen/teichoic acid export membrane protein
LTILAAHILGPSGVGVIFIGFAGYQLVLGLERAIVTQPLIADAAARTDSERRRLVGYGFSTTLVSGLALSAGFLVAGRLANNDTGRGLVLFAPWVVAALLFEFWKAVLFQERRARGAAMSDVVRMLVVIGAIPIAAKAGTGSAVVGAWGVGAAAGLVVGALVLRPPIGRVWQALAWFRGDGWLLGRWLGAREAVYQVSAFLTVIILARVIGSSDLGGLRAAESLFSPFSLIAAAFLLPALPALSRALTESRELARGLAIRISVFAGIFGFGYLVLMIFAGPWLFTNLFGASFDRYDDLIWPFAASQLFSAGSFAFGVLLIAEKRGGELLGTGIVGGFATLACATIGAWFHGVLGAAWGLTAATVVASALVVVLGSISPTRPAGR